MQITAKIRFWDKGVGCFCHEAVGRALDEAFEGVRMDATDLAHGKYMSAAEQPKTERSAWLEFLRSGPRYAFSLPSGTRGWLSRYEIGFDIADASDRSEVQRVRRFLEGMTLGLFNIEVSSG
ncbi:MAG: hypothetical protein AAF333_01980 [Planctomycetota bacterium]